MTRTFLLRDELERDTPYWGSMAWISRPSTTGANDLMVAEVEFAPDGLHDFHFHPGQEEVLYVLDGEVEQWVDQEMRLLGPGDSAFVPADAVHASFNVNDGPSRILVVVGPCVPPDGYVAVEVAEAEPWRSLRPSRETRQLS
jgi:quercetin dioxygenase-like cupin family protein